MNFRQIKIEFESELNSWWPVAGNTPIAWENVPFNSITNTYIVPEVVPAGSDKLELGRSGRAVIVGNFAIRVVGIVDNGTQEVWTKADLLNNHFSDYRFGSVYTLPGKIEIIGVEENKYQVIVLIPFRAYQNARS